MFDISWYEWWLCECTHVSKFTEHQVYTKTCAFYWMYLKKKAAEFKMIKDNHDLQREKTINQISLKVVRNRVPNWNGQTKIFIAVAERKAFGDTSRKKTVFGMKGQNHILKYIVFFLIP